ncbi:MULTISPECIES: GNAT family N-acetyltransferase [unclassified Streptomyces]|uniref:GNAT family N-acetyltransferase n=1 Tax=unclassified Streptomyces TaxID=2593676 RepID=UPI0006ADAB6D|nr:MULTISPECIES: GNAT family N-acetyltransferase [unclassified Streptomyces]KOX32435.1 acetyltransferase [Streptomyces sp. NRRL F-6491]KOX48428.1 acetyltransferase [Streptomyces sp. NRRL F-6492]
MTWHFTEDPAAFRAAAGALLSAEPARNTGVLTLVDTAGRLGWWTEPDGRVTGVLVVTEPGKPVFGTVTPEAARALASLPDLFGGEGVTALRGETAAVEAFAEATGRPWTATFRMRLFRLGTLTPPDPAPAGRARLATAADVPLAAAWAREFVRDLGEEPGEDCTGPVTKRISDGRMLLWEAEAEAETETEAEEADGRPVSMACFSPVTEGQSRVHLVYTPPAARGRGYAAGVTTAVTRAARDAGAAQVLLFTDLANPTSNALYRRLGYRPVTDHLTVAFTGR